jgi:hypothetical protein
MDSLAVYERTKHIRDTTLISACVFKPITERTHRRKETLTLTLVFFVDVKKALDKLI